MAGIVICSRCCLQAFGSALLLVLVAHHLMLELWLIVFQQKPLLLCAHLDPQVALSFTAFLTGSRSQMGQDLKVLAALPSVASGLFLDIGAFDGELYSNTWLLEKHGWKGVCAEPFPRDFSSRTCQLVAQPIASTIRTVKMTNCSAVSSDGLQRLASEWQWPGLKLETLAESSHIVGDENLAQAGLSVNDPSVLRECPTVEAETATVQVLLEKLGSPRVVDFISLDVEGMEVDILKSFPFNSVCVSVWMVEYKNDIAKLDQIKAIFQPLSYACSFTGHSFDVFIKCECALDELDGQKGRAIEVSSAVGYES
mmetsp:Transcript_18367/g.33287  ORF Transcript_18367/g.33287 Transcript_18367/m.33287 type:complete len:311 (-) Transcript_18367:77-1009(-)